jgi:hypothetical protein
VNSGDQWILEDCSIMRLADVIEHHEDFFSGTPEYKRLRCPVCSDSYQHVETWQVVPGRDNYEAGWGGRGDLVVLPVWGECEHRWELCFGSHKGETFCFVRVPHANWSEAGRAA